MNILITSIIDLRKSAHSRLHQFVNYLSQNHQITVLSINDWWKEKQTDVRLYSQSFENMLQRIEIRYLTNRKVSPILQEILSVVMLKGIFEEVNCDKFDVHLNYGTVISGYRVAKKVKTAGIKTVYDIADDLPQMIRNSPQIPPPLGAIGRVVGSIMVRRNIEISRKTVCTVKALRDSLNVPPERFELIPNGVDTELFRNYTPSKLRRELNIEGDFVVGYVGVLREWVDFEPVFSALKYLDTEYPNMKVLIVGEEGGLQLIKDLARRYEISPKVIFTGTVPYTKVPEYISCMDVCLIPFKPNAVSHSALPLKLFEYMACEKPVISSHLTGISQAVSDKVLYVSDERSYYSRLVALYNSRQLRESMGKAGRKLVQESYSWLRSNQKLERLLIQVIGYTNKTNQQL